MIVTFTAELWVWHARPAEQWTFVSLPAEESDLLREQTAGRARGFGSLRVRASIGGTTWQTSIFPDKERGVFVLPVKRAVRRAEDLDVDAVATVTVTVLGL
ncbi:DUF1905 domain-containing protein [Actinoplanes sp. NPDC051859]|uniref:DUF1905 domain-containing protein n=1 Tax=Actinoplanes sp. NPDC051859 TaxID=3363909 RepID=UPI0037BAC557